MLKLELKQLDGQVHYFFRGGWVGGWCGRVENKAISAFNKVEVEVEAELGKNQEEG